MGHKLFLGLALALTLVACASKPEQGEGGPRANIARDVTITLPVEPGYPEAVTYTQVLRARYGWRSATLETVLSLSPEIAEIVLTVPGGPRVATVRWNNEGVSVDRTVFTPPDLAPENMMADIYIAYWPADLVRQMLPRGLVLDLVGERTRIVRKDDRVILTIEAESETRIVIRNAELNYELTIDSQALE